MFISLCSLIWLRPQNNDYFSHQQLLLPFPIIPSPCLLLSGYAFVISSRKLPQPCLTFDPNCNFPWIQMISKILYHVYGNKSFSPPDNKMFIVNFLPLSLLVQVLSHSLEKWLAFTRADYVDIKWNPIISRVVVCLCTENLCVNIT